MKIPSDLMKNPKESSPLHTTCTNPTWAISYSGFVGEQGPWSDHRCRTADVGTNEDEPTDIAVRHGETTPTWAQTASRPRGKNGPGVQNRGKKIRLRFINGSADDLFRL